YVRLNRIIPTMALASRTMSQYVEEATGLHERYFELLAQMKPQASLALYIDIGRSLNSRPSPWTVPDRGWKAADFQGEDLRRIEHVFQVLEDNPSPAVQFYGLFNRLRFDQDAARVADK